MNCKLSIEILFVVMALIDLIPLAPYWVKLLVSLILICLICVLLWMWFISDRNEKKLNLMRPILLPQLKDIDYTNYNDKYNLCIDEKYPVLSDNVDSCLRRDNEALNRDIKLYNSLARAFVNDFNSKIISLAKLRLPIEHDDIGVLSRPLKYHTKHLYYEIGQQLSSFDEYRYGKHSPLGFNTRPITDSDEITRWKIDVGRNILFVSVDKTEIDEIEEEILKILGAAIHSTRFKELNRFFEQIKGEHEIYKKEIERVIRDLENGILCKEGLWQAIKKYLQ